MISLSSDNFTISFYFDSTLPILCFMVKYVMRCFVLLILALSFSSVARAHAPDQSYLYLRIYEGHTEGTVEMTFKDINTALGLSLERGMSVADLQPFLPAIRKYIKERIALSANANRYNLVFTEPELFEADMGVFLRSHFDLPGLTEQPDQIEVDYNILFDKDPKHQGMLVIGHHWKSGIVNNEGVPSLIFGKNKTNQSMALADASLWRGFVNMVRLGMWHIYIGLDHILFLLALLLPSVVRRKERPDGGFQWNPVEGFGPAFWYILKIVTWFTIAHSVTLALAAFQVINLSSRIVESIIALSIALAAVHNLRPIFGKREWLIALGFGLFHGLGFASVLGEKGLNGEFMTLSLLGFNVGVELGQILIVAAFFPFLFFLRKKNIYPQILKYGSYLLIAISLYWFIERFFEVDFLLDNYIGKAKNKLLSLIGL